MVPDRINVINFENFHFEGGDFQNEQAEELYTLHSQYKCLIHKFIHKTTYMRNLRYQFEINRVSAEHLINVNNIDWPCVCRYDINGWLSFTKMAHLSRTDMLGMIFWQNIKFSKNYFGCTEINIIPILMNWNIYF